MITLWLFAYFFDLRIAGHRRWLSPSIIFSCTDRMTDPVSDDSGLYTCIAWGDGRETRRSASLKVLQGESLRYCFASRQLTHPIRPIQDGTKIRHTI